MNTTWTGDHYPPSGYYTNLDRGWICPRCGRGNSPHNNVCPCVSSPAPMLPTTPWQPPMVPWKPFEPTIPDPFVKPWETTPWQPNISSPDWTWRPEFGPWYDSTRITC